MGERVKFTFRGICDGYKIIIILSIILLLIILRLQNNVSLIVVSIHRIHFTEYILH